jgi:hypothetical protein
VDSPKSSRDKTHRASDIHRVSQNIERESLHPVIHENAKVVPEERARDSEGPSGGDNEGLADNKERGRDKGGKGFGEERDAGLVRQSLVISDIGGCASNGRFRA